LQEKEEELKPQILDALTESGQKKMVLECGTFSQVARKKMDLH